MLSCKLEIIVFGKKQMKTKGIMSYLYFQDGHILIDEISPKERLGEFINNETKFYSMSMSKSVVSYILGHAICDGYIDGVDARVNDWPTIKDSLYHDQKLINFLNMSTGDQKYIDEFNDNELKDLEKLLFIEDEVIYGWYFQKNSNNAIPNTKVKLMLKNFKP